MALDVLQGASITTGGGFSLFHPQPPWQRSAVASYLVSAPQLPPAEWFKYPSSLQPGNPPPRTPVFGNRALPDVAAVAEALYMVLGGSDKQSATGVSFATPIWAGVVTLLNNARLQAGLPPMGAVAPFLYWAAQTNSSGFRDVTQGANRCFETPPWDATSTVNDTCCEHGFTAAAGYDVVTGLGTPNVEVLIELAIAAGRHAAHTKATRG